MEIVPAILMPRANNEILAILPKRKINEVVYVKQDASVGIAISPSIFC